MDQMYIRENELSDTISHSTVLTTAQVLDLRLLSVLPRRSFIAIKGTNKKKKPIIIYKYTLAFHPIRAFQKTLIRTQARMESVAAE